MRPLVGWTKLRLDPIERTAALDAAGMRLDPGPLSLGYAADKVLDVLQSCGLERAFVETDLGPSGRVARFAPPRRARTGGACNCKPPPVRAARCGTPCRSPTPPSRLPRRTA